MTTNTLQIEIPAGIAPERLLAVQDEAKTILSAVLTSMGVIDLTPDFARRREALITSARAVAHVQNTEDEAAAATAYKDLRALKKEVEAQSSGFKTPLNAAKTRIIDIVDTGLAPVETAMKRLKDMIDGHAEELLAAQRNAEAERQATIARAAAEQRAAEQTAARLIAEQEAARLAAEQAQRDADDAAKRAAEANSPSAMAEAEKAQQEAIKAQREQTRLALEAQDAQDLADAIAMMPEISISHEIEHAKGVSVRTVRDFGIIGDPDAYRMARNTELFAQWLFTTRPDLARFLKIEIRRADMLEFLKNEAAAAMIAEANPPGVKFFERIQSSHR